MAESDFNPVVPLYIEHYKYKSWDNVLKVE